MKAIILAGGRGTRLAPYTTIFPKPLMPLGDKPILEIVIRQLAMHGFKDITLAVGYLAELIMAYCGDGSKFGVKLSYSHEETPLGTAGPITLIPSLNETFLLMNGDLLTTLNFTNMLEYHKAHGGPATLAAYQREVKIDLGVVHYDENGWVNEYVEKPSYQYSVSTGIYIFEPGVLKYIPANQRFDLPDLVKSLIRAKQKVGAYKFDGYWLDIGRHDDYQTAIEEFQAHTNIFLPDNH